MSNASPSSNSQEPKPQRITVALAGNPNCGKTTLFNQLTGLRYKVANYPGVTVERKEGSFLLDEIREVQLVDLPGIYSLSGISIDEQIAVQAILGEHATIKRETPLNTAIPDVIVLVLDASNLERNLYLLSQLIDHELKVLVALNMCDIAEERGIQVHKELLERALDVPVVGVIASKGSGIQELKLRLKQLIDSGKPSSRAFSWIPGRYREYYEELGLSNLESEEHPDAPSPLVVGTQLLSESISPSNSETQLVLARIRDELSQKGVDSFSLETTARYEWINRVVERSTARSEYSLQTKWWEELAVHRVWGVLIFVGVMTIIFQAIFMWSEMPMEALESVITNLGGTVEAFLPEGAFRSLLVNGVIAGVGSVVVFVPQIAILFLFLGILEDSGYLTRAAYLMDRVLRPFGLQGRSFIPLLSSFACAIPGIMATRTIPSWADRMTTILVAPLMSCSARLPVYTVLIGAVVPEDYVFGFLSLRGLMLLAMYLLGIFGACVVSWLLRRTMFKGEPAIFVMEMPPFRRPTIRNISRLVLDSVSAFVRSAGTMILACSVILWFLAAYPSRPELEKAEQVKVSYAGQIGQFIEPAIRPLGMNWELGVAILGSFAAREVFVSSLATVYNLSDDEEGATLIETLRERNTAGTFSTLTGISLLVFYVFACQCMSTLAVVKRETGSWWWATFLFFYMTILAYLSSLATYQVGRFLV